MSKFKGSRAMVHFMNQLGKERFATLIDPTNTEKVNELCELLVKIARPVKMTIKGRTAMARLKEQLGDKRFAAMINPANIWAVKELCELLVKSAIPVEMTIEGRTYDIVRSQDERLMRELGHMTTTECAKDQSSNIGLNDCEHILKYQKQIPASLRYDALFIFINHHPTVIECVGLDSVHFVSEWCLPNISECVGWDGNRWVKYSDWFGSDWLDNFCESDNDRVLRRK